MNSNADLTTIPIPSFDSLTNDIYDIMRAHRNASATFNYLIDAYASIMKARKVTRIDLYHLLNAITDYNRFDPLDYVTDLNARVAIENVNRVFAAMDRAAAFAGEDDVTGLCFPLVIESAGQTTVDYAVLSDDPDDARARKLAAQTPSIPSIREYYALAH